MFITLQASDIDVEKLAKKLHLSAGTKAIIQWERVFKSKRKMKRYKIDTLSTNEKNKLKEYLIKHAIDSDKPMVAGE
jgi:ribosomal protein L32